MVALFFRLLRLLLDTQFPPVTHDNDWAADYDMRENLFLEPTNQPFWINSKIGRIRQNITLDGYDQVSIYLSYRIDS